MSFWRESLFYHAGTAASRPLVACSACLLGEPVRYDGGHKEQPGFGEWLSPWLQLQAICPEVGIGLGIPRPTLKVVDKGDTQRVVEVKNPAVDVTDSLLDYADSYLRKLGRFWPLTAWIFKARSPSCGSGSTPVNPDTSEERLGEGAFAGRVRLWAPWLPLYEEDALQQKTACERLLLESFICRDILWQASEPAPAGTAKHYAKLLETPLAIDQADSLALWGAVVEVLRKMDGDRRQRLIDTYRAA
jgi:uncharacterized protein YbbK (DUF523 family)